MTWVGDIEPHGNRVVRTPGLRRLAGDSLRFTRDFAPWDRGVETEAMATSRQR